MPKVSVLMPCFNGAKYILKAIDSVLSQSFRDFELLIFDDQSTDGTFEIVSKLTDFRIKVFRNASNLGLVGNWNNAIEKSSGEYIHFRMIFCYPGLLSLRLQHWMLIQSAPSASALHVLLTRMVPLQ